ncbi:hypothetical protein CWS02_08180 [Enterobacter sp. EA-1]|nr:hypothetical protein CWS02_08180 [Enterobacter sp. EA-1]
MDTGAGAAAQPKRVVETIENSPKVVSKMRNLGFKSIRIPHPLEKGSTDEIPTNILYRAAEEMIG